MSDGRFPGKSNCLDDVAKMGPGLAGAKFLPPSEAQVIYAKIFTRLRKPHAFCWSSCTEHGLSLEEGLDRMRSWPEPHCYLMFLDLSDDRVLRLCKDGLDSFIDDFVYPTEDSYFVSQDLLRVVSFDHHEWAHSVVFSK